MLTPFGSKSSKYMQKSAKSHTTAQPFPPAPNPLFFFMFPNFYPRFSLTLNFPGR